MENETVNTQSPDTGAQATATTGPRVIFCTPSMRWRTAGLFFLLLALCVTALAMLGMSTGTLDVNIDGTPMHGAGAVAIAVAALAVGLLVAAVALVGVTLVTVIAVVLVACFVALGLVAAVSPLLVPIIVLIVLIKWLAKK